MKQITFQLKTITPMFMAGADGTTFELRPPSIKGELRFWWRAYYWGTHTGNISAKDLEAAEGAIFGTASNAGRRSRVTIRIESTELQGTIREFPKRLVPVEGKTFQINILEYLAYGTLERQNVFHRQYLPIEQEFSISFHIIDEKIQRDVLMSFYFLAVFGGLGAKSRNGFGGFTVMNPDVFTRYACPYTYPFPDTKEILTFKTFNPEIPTFTAFSKDMKIFKLRQTHSAWDTCLAEIGGIYRKARNHLDDRHYHYEKRQYIGAPIVAHKKTESRLERHAKPYFMRVVKQGEKQFAGYIIYLSSKYCEGLEIDNTGQPIHHDQVNDDFQVSCNQFNQLLCDHGMEVVL
jgi:CRISPR-associated protein Cmr1